MGYVKSIIKSVINAVNPPISKSLSDILHKDANYTYSKTTDSLEAIADAIAVIDSGTDKIGTISNVGGVATIGGALGDIANNTLISRLNTITTETNKIPAEIIKTASIETKIDGEAIKTTSIESKVDGEAIKTTAIQAVTDVLPDSGAFTTEFVKTAAIRTAVDTTIPGTITTIDGLFDISSLNSAANSTMRDVLGGKTDTYVGNSIYSKLSAIGNYTQNRTKAYPYLATGITLPGSTTALTLGAITEIVPTATNEIDTLTIAHTCDVAGNVTIDLDGIKYTKAVSIGTINEVATQLRAYTYGEWTVAGADADIIFTKLGMSTTGAFSNLGATGITGSFAKTQTGVGIGRPFGVQCLQFGIANVTDTYIVNLYSGLAGYEDMISTIRTTRTSAQSSASPVCVASPIIPAGTRITASVATISGGEDTIVCSIEYFEY